MRRMAVNYDGETRMVWRYEVDELGSRPSAPRNTSLERLAKARMIMGLMGGPGKEGPLMRACLRNAEHPSRGGHRHTRKTQGV